MEFYPKPVSQREPEVCLQNGQTRRSCRDYEDALLWLESAGLIYRVFCTSKPFLPLKAYDDLSAFKVYLSDVGLLRELSGLPPELSF